MADFRPLRCWSLICLAIGSAAAATTGDGATITKRTSIPIRLGKNLAELGPVSRIDYYQTTDNGRSWLRIHSDDPNAGKPLGYTFRAAGDGRYGFRTCLTWADGRKEQAPRPGQAPTPRESLVIDTTKPVVRFERSFPDPDNLRGRIAISWAVSDLHNTATPAQLQYRDAEDQWHDLGPARPPAGTDEIAVPVEALALRLAATDLAGNASQSGAEPLPRSEPEPEPVAAVPAPVAAVPEPETPPAAPPSLDETAAAVAAETPEAEPVPATAPAPTAPVTEAPAPGPALVLPSRAELLAARQASDERLSQRFGADAVPERPPEPIPAEQPAAETVEEASDETAQVAPEQATSDRQAEAQAEPAMSPVVPLDDGLPLVNLDGDAALPPATSTDAPAPQPSTDAADEPGDPAPATAANDESQSAPETVPEPADSAPAPTAPVDETELFTEMNELNRLGAFEQSLERYEAAVTRGLPASTALRCRRAVALLALGRADEAAETLARVSAEGPHGREASFLMALALRGMDERAQARAIMRNLAQGDDHWAESAAAWIAAGG